MGDNRSRPRAGKTWPVRLKPETRKCLNWRERAGAEVDQHWRVTQSKQPGSCVGYGPRRRSHRLGRLHRRHHFIENHHSRPVLPAVSSLTRGIIQRSENKKRQKYFLPTQGNWERGLQRRPGREKNLFLENEREKPWKTPALLAGFTQLHACMLTPWMKHWGTQ